MTTRKTSLFGGTMAALFLLGVTLAPRAAQASEEGRRNTMLGLGAATAYLFTRGGNKLPAFVGLGATAYAYKRYDDAMKARRKRQRAAAYRRYRRGYANGYQRGVARHRR